MKLHVKPNKIIVIVLIFAFALLLVMELWALSIYKPKNDVLAMILFFLFLESLLLFNLSCVLRSYTLDTDGIYVKWHIVNKTHFYSWTDFKDNYCMRSNIVGEYLDTVVFSKKKRLLRVSPARVVIEGFCPFSTVGIVICDDTAYSPKKHSHCVCKSQFLELMQHCNILVEWNSKL
ncbi:MAG: hypothetical protein IJ017_00505 [Oscillospiraceae bacterium]|nr:hypothetical protein [Oscillospiraceae bacterium]